MELNKYLCISSNGSVRITANKPRLAVNEIAMLLNIDVPDQLFDRPLLVADIKIDEDVAMEELISSETVNNAKEITFVFMIYLFC